MSDKDSWEQWNKHVLIELKRLREEMEKASQDRAEIKTALKVNEIKSGFWGTLGGALSGIFLVIGYWIKKGP